MPSLKSRTEVLMDSQVDGATLVAAAAASALPAAAKYTFEPGYFGVVGKAIRLRASGRQSCAVTTPGTARWDTRLVSPVPTTVVAFDGLAMNMNIVAKVNVHWWLDITLVARVIGGAAQLFPGPAMWGSEACVGSPLPTVGGSGMLNLPVATAPALGAAFDATLQQTLDLFYTPSLGTASMTLHNYFLEALN